MQLYTRLRKQLLEGKARNIHIPLVGMTPALGRSTCGYAYSCDVVKQASDSSGPKRSVAEAELEGLKHRSGAVRANGNVYGG